jgi:hypothetical protein
LSNPTPYDPTYSYTGFSVGQGDNSFPGPQIDADFAALNITTDQTITALADVRRSDGALVNEIVTYDSLDPELKGMFSDAASAAEGPIYSTVVGMANIKVTDGITALRVNGYYAPGDGGEALYVRAGVQPSHNGKFQSADGAWWALSESAVNVKMFGARGDWNGAIGTDDTAAFQNFIDYLEAKSVPGGIPPARYRLTGPVYIGRTNGMRLTGVAKTFTNSFIGASVLVFDVADGTNGVIIGSTTAGERRDGIEIDGLMIFRNTAETKSASGGIGITYRGLIQPIIRNLTVYNFAVNAYITEATGGGATSGGYFETVRYEDATHTGCLIDAALECEFAHGKFGAAPDAVYNLRIKKSPTNYAPNGNYFSALTIISDGTVPHGADYNLYDDSKGFFNTFEQCAFEGANINNIAGVGGAVATVYNTVFSNCSTNAAGAGTLYFEDYNVNLNGGSRWHNNGTDACITFKRNTAGASALIANVTGNYIDFIATAGIVIDGYNGVTVTGNKIQDRNLTGLPAVIIQNSGAESNVIVGNKLLVSHSTGVVDSLKIRNIIRANTLQTTVAVDQGPVTIGGPQQTLASAVPAWQYLGIDGNSASQMFARYSANNGAPTQRFFKSRGATVGSRAAVVDADDIFQGNYYGDDGASDVEAVRIRSFVSGTPSSGIVPGAISVYTRNGSGLTEKFRVGPDGAMLFGLGNYANDAAAAIGLVPIGGLYRNGSVLMIRVA